MTTSPVRAASLPGAIHHLAMEVERLNDELIDWLRRHPLPGHSDAKLIDQATKAAVPKGASGDFDWAVWFFLNNVFLDDNNSVIYQVWYPGLFR